MINERYELLLDIAANYRIQVVRAVHDRWYWWQEGDATDAQDDLSGPYPSALAALEDGCKSWIETFMPWTPDELL